MSARVGAIRGRQARPAVDLQLDHSGVTHPARQQADATLEGRRCPGFSRTRRPGRAVAAVVVAVVAVVVVVVVVAVVVVVVVVAVVVVVVVAVVVVVVVVVAVVAVVAVVVVVVAVTWRPPSPRPQSLPCWASRRCRYRSPWPADSGRGRWSAGCSSPWSARHSRSAAYSDRPGEGHGTGTAPSTRR